MDNQESWEKISKVSPGKLIGPYKLRELPREACCPSVDPQDNGRCEVDASCPDPRKPARRQSWNSKDRTEAELLSWEIKRLRSKLNSMFKEYMEAPEGAAEHAALGVPGYSIKYNVLGPGINTRLELLSRYRHKEHHMGEQVVDSP